MNVKMNNGMTLHVYNNATDDINEVAIDLVRQDGSATPLVLAGRSDADGTDEVHVYVYREDDDEPVEHTFDASKCPDWNHIRLESNPLSEYSLDELYRELRRRGHYDVYEVTASDLDSDMREWAENNGKLDDLMLDWQRELICETDFGCEDVVYDVLYEVAERLGYEA